MPSTRSLSARRRRLLGCRLIFALTTLLLLVMPVTERLYDSGPFLHGGTHSSQDMEFTLLGGLILCGIATLIAEDVVLSPLHGLLWPPDRRRFVLRLLFGLSAPLARPPDPAPNLLRPTAPPAAPLPLRL